MTTVLISEPNASKTMTFLPYVWGVLKTACEQVEELRDAVVWLEPIYERDFAAALLAPYDLSVVDVLGLSCYTWNFDLQCEIAAIAKRANPGILIVAGGPHPQIKDPDFFRRHPYIDVVVAKDGEETFNTLLKAVLRDEREFFNISGLYLPKGESRDVTFTGAPVVPQRFAVSPYVAQADYYNAVLASAPTRYFGATWETTRGCPYSCSFCDWGSNTMSKIRVFEIERVEAELEWLMQSSVSAIMMADANFGILPRDLQIADRIAQHAEASGQRKLVHYSAAKNNPERSLAITRRLMGAGVLQEHMLSVQHANPDVLASISRSNISPDKQVDVARRLLEAGAPIDVQLIIGIPGDTYELWKASLARLMEWGLHEDYCVFFFSLLPNAPAADRSYRELWQISSIKRVIRDQSTGMRTSVDEGIPQELIIGSKNFSSAQWAAMNSYTSIVRALHAGGITRMISIFLNKEYGIRYLEFYEDVIERFIKEIYLNGELYQYVERIYLELLIDESAVANQTTVPELCDDTLTLCVAHAALVRIAIDIDGFYAGLGDFLLQTFAQVDPALLRSAIDYQRAMLVLPGYDPAQGKQFPLAHDWPAYFSEVASASDNTAHVSPAPLVGMVAQVEDRAWHHAGIARTTAWVHQSGPECWRNWAEFAMLHGHKIANVLHQNVRTVPAQQPADNRCQRLVRQFGMLRQWLPDRMIAG